MISADCGMNDGPQESNIPPSIPQQMSIAHRAVLYDLWDASTTGLTGSKTVRGLSEHLNLHFTREEELMGAIFSLDDLEDPLSPRHPGRQPFMPFPEDDDMDAMASFLESELWDLCSEHDELRATLEELKAMALVCSDPGLHDLALRLEAHLDAEEQDQYPAAMRTLETVRIRPPPPPGHYPPPSPEQPPQPPAAVSPPSLDSPAG